MNHRDRRWVAAALALYTGLLLWLIHRLPFWLDEILQLIGTTQPGFAAFLTYHRTNPGGVPLGYLLQFWLIATFGLNFVSARLPSVLASVLACAALVALGREIGVRSRWVALVIFMILPIQLRYAVEGRIYSHGLLFAILATWCLVRLDRNPTTPRAVLYALTVAASLYSQGFAAFMQPGQVLWLIAARRRRSFVLAAAALLAAGAMFLPWYLWTRPAWQQTITASEFHFQSSPRVLVALVREISGDGWAASLPLIGAAICGFFHLDRRWAGLLACGIASGVALGFAADHHYGYFFAIRQFFFITPQLVLLAATGAVGAFTAPSARLRAVAAALTLVFAGGALAKNVAYFTHPHEDWVAAAHLLHETADAGFCLALVPKDEARLYTLFDPSVDSARCRQPVSSPQVAMVANLYSAPSERDRLAATLVEAGFQASAQRSAGGTTVTMYRKYEQK
jgi:4-amino-4-deoxy-L-arabinose transferase-like glycosyltransferase